MEVGRLKRACGGQVPEQPLDQGLGLVGVDVAEERDDHVLRHEVAGVVRSQVAAREGLDACGLAAGLDVIGRGGGQGVAEGSAISACGSAAAVGDLAQGQLSAPWRTLRRGRRAG